ncbi:mortality factor 4-like protein 1 [Nematocida displodere]|uniref:Mortality factor 4-like protein 1 n=1 Tax=Nematocida displodere TaxID=1805483 RepID=A0A177EGV2_9MICR|nr:mortality factor 4-like protein 1 [Nematocida displodere]
MSIAKASHKAAFSEGMTVFITTETIKEKAIIIEKKDKMRGSTKLSPIYKIKTLNGLVRWIPESNIQLYEETCTAPPAPAQPLVHPWPKLSLMTPLREILFEEKRQMQTYTEPVFSVSADEIFNMFFEYGREIKPHCAEEIKEATLGLKELFLFTTHTRALYPEERPHYTKHLYPQGELAILKAYGLPHILRMILVLPEIHSKLELSNDLSAYILDYVKAFIEFLEDNYTKMIQR